MKDFIVEVKDIEWFRDNVPCYYACPVHTDSGRYVQLIAEQNYTEAFLIAHSPNPFSSICGRICSAPCEDACRRGRVDSPVSIRALKRFLTEKYGVESSDSLIPFFLEGGVEDKGFKTLWHIPKLLKRRDLKNKDKRIAIIGGGPAGLSCAHDLALVGYKVVVFEATESLGGMIRHGVPGHRLDKGVLDKISDEIVSLGVEVKKGVYLDEKYGIRKLKEEFDAIFIASGTWKADKLKIEGAELDGITTAVDFLLNVNKGYRLDLGKKVIVIGGGSVALDAARTAIREMLKLESTDLHAIAQDTITAIDVARSALRTGAREVMVFSLESFEEMPARKTIQGKEEFEEALMEGIKFYPSYGPKRFIGDGKRVKGVEFLRCERVFDEKGMFNPLLKEGTEVFFECDSVILAIGQKPHFPFISKEDGIELTPFGTIKVDIATNSTTSPGVFAGGDAVYGPRTLIQAVADGKKAALSIDEYLKTKGKKEIFFIKPEERERMLNVKIELILTELYTPPDNYEFIKRKKPPTISLDKRVGIVEVEKAYPEDEAIEQAKRCLSCHIYTIYDGEKCVLCGGCVDICPKNCIKFIPFNEAEFTGENKIPIEDDDVVLFIKDDDECIRCGLCAKRCPTGAITMERFHFEEDFL
jgi:NADPH-dependent glutamate synthase beta subunit-like oxidoreductase